jgi:hypothetical protein
MAAAHDELLSRLQEVREVLMYTFDFELLVPAISPDAFSAPSPWAPSFSIAGRGHSVVARDATGAVYVSCELAGASEGFVVHVDTQGYSVSLGEGLGQTVALVLALPYYREILRETTGDLIQMRELAARFEAEVCRDLPALPAARNDLFSCLPLPIAADPVAQLHQLAVLSPTPVSILSPHGWQYESLVQRPA